MNPTAPAIRSDANPMNVVDPDPSTPATDLHHGVRRPSSRPVLALPATARTTHQASSRPVPVGPVPAIPAEEIRA